MDVDALAREALTHFAALDFGWPAFPPYLRTWFQGVEREFGGEVWEQAATIPAVETLERTGERHAGGLDAYFYRAEPGASAFGIVQRGEELVYVSLLGGVYGIPERDRLAELDLPYPAHQLIWFALMQAFQAAGAEGPSWTQLRNGPVSVSAAVDGEAFAQLEVSERTRIVARCTEIARDLVRLYAGDERPATLRLVAKAPPVAEGERMIVTIGNPDLVTLEQVLLF
jgi:hypothetical protein